MDGWSPLYCICSSGSDYYVKSHIAVRLKTSCFSSLQSEVNIFILLYGKFIYSVIKPV